MQARSEGPCASGEGCFCVTDTDYRLICWGRQQGARSREDLFSWSVCVGGASLQAIARREGNANSDKLLLVEQEDTGSEGAELGARPNLGRGGRPGKSPLRKGYPARKYFLIPTTQLEQLRRRDEGLPRGHC